MRHIIHRRPRRHMENLPLRDRMILQQRLHVLPARQLSDIAYARRHDIVQAIPRAVPKNRTLHVRRHQLAATHGDLAAVADDALRDVKRVVVVFGEAEGDGDFVFARAGLDGSHLWGVDGEGVFDVACGERWVHCSGPVEREDIWSNCERGDMDGQDNLSFTCWVVVDMGINSMLSLHDLPHPRWIARDPAFRERDEFRAIAGGFGDERAGLLDGSVQVEPLGLCLRDGYADGFWGCLGGHAG